MATVLLIAAFAYAALCATLFVFQRSLLYFPQPSSLGDRDTTFALPTPEARVLVSVRAHGGERAVVYFGGNGEDVTRSLPGIEAAFPDRALYLLHYRGYGGSTGAPTEPALLADALALFDIAHAEHPEVVVIGRSLGSGLAVHVAAVRPASRLVLVTPYDSLMEIAATRFPFVPVRWLLLDRFESWRYAPQVTAPTVLVAAEHDEVIPRASTDKLLSRFKAGVASLKIVPDAGHNSISERTQYGPWLNGSGD
jgi:pimeloyl-ACP methyl ester carboxylesterase